MDTPFTAQVGTDTDTDTGDTDRSPGDTADPGAPVFLHRRFEKHARARPDAAALVSGHRSQSYDELNRRANRLARHLVALGVRPDDRVALWMERGIELITAILAVLKAGAAYVPLDPGYPRERLTGMLDDSAPMLVLTLRAAQAEVPAEGTSVVAVDAPEVAAALAGLAEGNVDPAVIGLEPQHLACLIYTSGSTGVPKGVMLQHSGLNKLLRALPELFAVGPDSHVLQFSSPSFDASLLDIALALCFGGRLCLASRGELLPGEPLVRTLERHGVTHVTVPPSALAVLDADVRLPTVRTLCVAGEVCSPAVTRRWAPQHRLINIYGPTETTIFVTAEVCANEYPGPTPIGYPVAGAAVRILDDRLQPVPDGERGEIYIGGECVSRGYLNKPELSVQRFLPDPYSDRPGARMYKTGDIGRRLPAGNIEYTGRSDFQVKIRGFRIELGEIEARLAQCPAVREAVVVCREDVPGDKRLVAYLTAVAPPQRTSAAQLRAQLERFLPAYMLPAAYVWLERYPLTPNGKTHRAALPSPRDEDYEIAPYAAPEGKTETTLAAIWQEVLQIDAVGRHDSFFVLGGHSLRATQLASRVQARLGVMLPLRIVFERPTLEALARWIDGARAAGGGSHVRADENLRVRRVPRDGPLPCTYSQRRMWLAQQFTPQTTAYNVAVALRLRGALDAAMLGRALEDVARAHEAFRTHFEMRYGEPMQFVGEYEGAALAQVDLSALDEATRLDKTRRLLGDHTARPFDLSTLPLHRTLLVRLGARDHVLLWVMHHVISDLWSVGLVFDELLRRYGALQEGRVTEPASRPFEYADYAARERDTSHQTTLAGQYAYWQGRLRGLQPLSLPTDRPRLGPLSGRGATLQAPLPAAATEALRPLCHGLGATPFMALLACYVLMLSRRSGQHDFAVAVPIANRHHIESESLVGTLVNTLAMRNDASGNPTFAELLARVQATALQAYAHQDTPLEHLIERFAERGSKLYPPLVQVLFNVLNAPFEVTGHAGFEVEDFAFDQRAAQFELSLSVDTERFGQVVLEYSTDLYTADTAQRFLDGYLALLVQVIADPHRAIGDYALLGEVERACLARWNDSAAPLPAVCRIDQFVTRAGMPGQDTRCAISSPEGGPQGGLSHAELDAQVNRMARALRQRGIGRGALVGLCVERSVAMVVAQLAIARAGAAYVPLDPAYPIERLATMIDDAGLALLVTEAVPLATLGWPASRSLLIDVDAGRIAAQPAAPLAADPALDAGPDDPAYVIYTSGSSGRPKGVVVPHRAAVNFIAAMLRRPGLGRDDTLLAVTTPSFDIALLELLGPLAAGGRVVLARRDELQDGHALRRTLESCGANVMQATPTTWQMLVSAGWTGAPGFRALVGGEPLPAGLARELLGRTSELWNLYGPTETTVWSTCWRVEHPDGGIRIGTPIDNTEVHVLDARLQPCPVGVPGEVCIAGTGVASGYLRRPELTAERFIERDLGRGPLRLYRTGDRGRWCADGQLEHLGRFDFQVKLRGHRIELGEIEAHLLRDAQVAQCVVQLREDRPGDARLVAYVVAPHTAPAPAELRQQLRRQLPESMVPQHYVMLDALPLLPNGKIDRAALPAPGDAALVRDALYWVPRTDAEVAVAEIWQRLLGVEQLSSSDNFFDLGGHSLLAMRAVDEMWRSIGIAVGVRRLVFETLEQIAATPPAEPGHAARAEPPQAVRERTTRYLIGGLKRMLARKPPGP